MTAEEREKITSNDFFDLIVEYRSNPQLLEIEDATVHIMNEGYAIVYLPASQLDVRNLQFRFSELPNLFGLTDETSLNASGVSELRNIPVFNLQGGGTLIAIIDTGIDYTNPVFLRNDGTTKIAALWDQTIDSQDRYPVDYNFGTEFSREEINQALVSDNPLEIVPSIDENGHGTMMAGIAVGNPNVEESFYGIAPEAELVIVKLRQAKQVLREFFAIPEDSICYAENTIMWALQYCLRVARREGKPIVICLGMGTSQDAHDGRSPLSVMSSSIGDFPNTVVVTTAGNEGNRGRHFYGIVDPQIGNTTVELNVGDDETGFSMELWGDSPGIFSIDILSPSGEFIPRIPAGLRVNRVISFIFETTIIYVDYQTVETLTGDQLILFRFHNITPGVWRFTVYGQSDLSTGFHIWLPMGDFITDNTYFIQPNIYTTVLSPGTASIPITVTAYNPINGNLYVNSGRGYTRAGVVKPEIAAPGVNYIAPALDGAFTTYSGTSVATAHTAGIAALFLEWGTVRGSRPNMDSVEVKNYLIRGARRRANLTYPNRDWGYGILDILNVFDLMRADAGTT